MSYIAASMRRDEGKIPAGGKNVMLSRDSSVYDPSQSLHRLFHFHFTNLAESLCIAARDAGPAILSTGNANFIRRRFAARPEPRCSATPYIAAGFSGRNAPWEGHKRHENRPKSLSAAV